MPAAGLPALGRQVLTLERQVVLHLTHTAMLLSPCPPAAAVLAPLQTQLAGAPAALNVALQSLGDTSAVGTAAVGEGLVVKGGAASLAIAALGGLLTEAALACGALHATAHRAYASVGDGNLADLADAQMQAYLTAAAAIGEVVSEVAVWELEQAGMECECHCSACGLGICLCARHGKEMVASARQNASSRPGGEGIAVRRLPSGSRAALAGLESEDVIVSVAEHPIADPLDLLRAIRELPAGADVALTITRGDTTREVVVSRA